MCKNFIFYYISHIISPTINASCTLFWLSRMTKLLLHNTLYSYALEFITGSPCYSRPLPWTCQVGSNSNQLPELDGNYSPETIVLEINSKKRQSPKLVYLYHCNVIISNSAEKSFFLENRKHRKNLMNLWITA